MFRKELILKALTKVIHPEKGKDIVALGIVAEIESGKEGISITLKPEKSNDPFISSVKSSIVRAIKEDLGKDAVVSNITIQPRAAVHEPEKQNDGLLPGVVNIVAVSSGKGGVGKTTIAVNLAIAVAGKGFSVGLLDADVFGPSVPKMLNAEKYRPEVIRKNDTDYIVPLSKYGMKILSPGFFVDPADALVWRGPMASSFLKQLMAQGEWGSLDFLFIDLPPGTSDIHLTLVQEVAVTGAIIVTTPQEVALADAIKGISMFRSDRINVPVLGLVENMSWFTPAELPDNKYHIFGKDGGRKLAGKMNVPLLGQIPLVQSICEGSDKGDPAALGDTISAQAFKLLADQVVEKVELRNRNQKPTVKVNVT